jgi:beta-glucanase (GH16 family)
MRSTDRTRRAWIAAATAAATAGLLAVTAAAYAGESPTAASNLAAPNIAAPAAVGAPPAGFTLTWSDDFTGAANTGVNTGTWKYDTGPGSSFGTGEIETMTNSTANVFQDGAGHLVLRALHSGTNARTGWTSGRIETQAATFGAAPGGVVRMESRIQQPNVTTANGAGYWPAFWMLGAPLRSGVTWPTSGEVDILEDINGRSSVFGTLHCGTNPGGPCNESSGLGSGERACSGCQTGYHNYAVEIDRSKSPEEIRWYLDGANYFTLPANRVDATTWANAVDHPFFIIYDLAMGGGFPDAFGGGPNASTISGGQMNIDWVAVYNKGPGSTTPPPSGTNLSQGKPTTASSTENAGTPASAATDGNTGTRWSSAFSDPQWVRVDLGATHAISKVALNWEAAYAKAFQIQTSNDGTNWTTVYSTTTGTGGNQTLTVSGSGRYVRMNGTQRATQYGYSLWEFLVSGSCRGGGPPGPAGAPPAPISGPIRFQAGSDLRPGPPGRPRPPSGAPRAGGRGSWPGAPSGPGAGPRPARRIHRERPPAGAAGRTRSSRWSRRRSPRPGRRRAGPRRRPGRPRPHRRAPGRCPGRSHRRRAARSAWPSDGRRSPSGSAQA